MRARMLLRQAGLFFLVAACTAAVWFSIGLSCVASDSAAPSPSGSAPVYESGARRDPFAPLVRDGKIVSVSAGGGAGSSDATGPLVLDGILWDAGGQSIALINGSEVKAGDQVGGYVVRTIRKDAVVLEKGNEVLVLQINFEAMPTPKKREGS